MSSNLSMTQLVDEYLAMRRAFGYQLTIAGELLHGFAAFAERTAPGSSLTLDLALGWAQANGGGKRSSAARRLVILRPFARYLRTIDRVTEVPPKGILGPAQHRHIPHIYSDQEVHALLEAANELRPRDGLRPRSVRTYLSLLLCTGMRPPEPLRLTGDDVDFSNHTITIRETKFSKSRIVVVHSTTTEALHAYAVDRDQLVEQPQSPYFFLMDDGSALTHKKAIWAFRRMRRQLGWESKPGQRLPRLYDFRHTFVCRRLLEWYRAGVDVHLAMPSLSTYMGHVKITDTYWYLTGIPELMNVVAARFEQFACGTDGGQRCK